VTTSAELRAIVADAPDARPFIEIATDQLDSLKGKSVPPRIREALRAEGEAFQAEFRSWLAESPDTLVRLARLRAFSVWCSRVNAELKKP